MDPKIAEAYRLGRTAYRDGARKSANPYAKHGGPWSAWRRGWFEQRQDALKGYPELVEGKRYGVSVHTASAGLPSLGKRR